ncbi:MAG TPA: outer membrane beta-barrel protein [candidate division Zixibacteria bacterium]|nr:outer membrane beta-barrel protein [candidate division Zixibacteria bacterium]
MQKLMIATALVVLLAVSASAQVSSPIKLYAGGGISFPQTPDEFSDNFKTGWHGMGGISMLVFPRVSAMGKVMYNQFSNDLDQVDGGELKVTMFGADARVDLGFPTMPIKPIVFGGIGLANVKLASYDISGLTEGDIDFALEDQTKFYYNIGGGLEWKLMPAVSAFGQATWITIATDGDNSSFWSLTAGVKLL